MTLQERSYDQRPVGAGWRIRPLLHYPNLPKRVIDVMFVFLSVPFVLPLLACLLIIVASDGHSPIYRQRRIGRGGRIYTLLKIRTMVPDAQDMLNAHLAGNPAARAEWDTYQKLRDDPRVTIIGSMLRKSSLDELPQLWNVLRGEMSLVGPRPMLVEQRDLYPGSTYYRLRPGLTGAWQVSDRNHSSFAERATFDDAYYESLSLGVDLQILARTLAVVLRGTGY